MTGAKRMIVVRISGRVQGVWFRDWTKRQAEALGLTGWVRNRPDKTVEVLLSGAAAEVEAMIEKCYQGSPLSRVDEVTLFEHEGERVFQGFEIRKTG